MFGRAELVLATTILFAITAASQTGVEYRVLATPRTSTMERELNDAAREGYLLSSAIGGETEFGGSELVAVVERDNSPSSTTPSSTSCSPRTAPARCRPSWNKRRD
jgi:hypothetical protein